MNKTVKIEFDGWKAYTLLLFAFIGVLDVCVAIPLHLAGYVK